YDVGNLRFDGQVEIEGIGTHSFSDGGDSGSLIVDGDIQAVALLFAGGDTGASNGLGLTFRQPNPSGLEEPQGDALVVGAGRRHHEVCHQSPSTRRRPPRRRPYGGSKPSERLLASGSPAWRGTTPSRST